MWFSLHCQSERCGIFFFLISLFVDDFQWARACVYSWISVAVATSYLYLFPEQFPFCDSFETVFPFNFFSSLFEILAVHTAHTQRAKEKMKKMLLPLCAKDENVCARAAGRTQREEKKRSRNQKVTKRIWRIDWRAALCGRKMSTWL